MYDGRLEEAETELNRAKEINPTGSDLLYEIEGILKFWQEDYSSSKTLLGQIRLPSPIASVFIAAADFYTGEKEMARQRVLMIETEFSITVQRLFGGESYRLDAMKAKIAPLFPIRQVA